RHHRVLNLGEQPLIEHTQPAEVGLPYLKFGQSFTHKNRKRRRGHISRSCCHKSPSLLLLILAAPMNGTYKEVVGGCWPVAGAWLLARRQPLTTNHLFISPIHEPRRLPAPGYDANEASQTGDGADISERLPRVSVYHHQVAGLQRNVAFR